MRRSGSLSVVVDRFVVVGQGHPGPLGLPGKGIVVGVGEVPVVLRIGMDGSTRRVPFSAGEQSWETLSREQIGCELFEVISLDAGLDMWVDEESLVQVDLSDVAALAEALNPVATLIANHFGRRQPVFGVAVVTGVKREGAAALDAGRLAVVEELAALSAVVANRVLAAHRVAPEPTRSSAALSQVEVCSG